MRPERRLALLASLAFLALCSWAQEQAVNVNKILVMPGTPVVQLVVEADGPLSAPRGYYLPDAPSTFALDLDGARTSATPVVPPSEAPFIRDLQVQRPSPRGLRILARLNERVPVRLRTEDRRAVVEFAKVQRYSLDADVRAQLASQPKGGIFLEGIDPAEAADRVSFRVQLSGQAVAQVFCLENPWRLVVDLYDTVLRAKPLAWEGSDPRVPVQKVRAGQFRMSDPRPIARLVFDLRAPGVYSVDPDKAGLVVSFYKNEPLGASETKAAPVEAAPAPRPAPKEKERTPKTSPASSPATAPGPPLVRRDLLKFATGDAPAPRRDIFRSRSFSPPGPPPAAAGRGPAPKGKASAPAAAETFTLELVYIGSIRTGGTITALVMRDGQTTPVAVGDEIIPGYKVLRITPTRSKWRARSQNARRSPDKEIGHEKDRHPRLSRDVGRGVRDHQFVLPGWHERRDQRAIRHGCQVLREGRAPGPQGGRLPPGPGPGQGGRGQCPPRSRSDAGRPGEEEGRLGRIRDRPFL
ncbi:MAG TPA: AMIN domain-containing protein [Burkholderiales bacterium]|nr:AMIN domain-containing protein [Burkholderiales bacterium]